MSIEFNLSACIRCGACVKDCPVKILASDENGHPYVVLPQARYCMNCHHCLAVCPAGAVTCNGVSANQCSAPSPLSSPEDMMSLIRQRRSTRYFEEAPVTPEQMTLLKDSLKWAPTGCNHRGLCFTIVETRDEMAFYRNQVQRVMNIFVKSGLMKLIYPRYSYLEKILGGEDMIFRDAPHMIVCSVSKKAPCKEADPWIALTQFDMLAQSMGIGTCWCGFALHAFQLSGTMRKRLHIPRGYRVGSVMLFGKAKYHYARSTSPAAYPILESGED